MNLILPYPSSDEWVEAVSGINDHGIPVHFLICDYLNMSLARRADIPSIEDSWYDLIESTNEDVIWDAQISEQVTYALGIIINNLFAFYGTIEIRPSNSDHLDLYEELELATPLGSNALIVTIKNKSTIDEILPAFYNN